MDTKVNVVNWYYPSNIEDARARSPSYFKHALSYFVRHLRRAFFEGNAALTHQLQTEINNTIEALDESKLQSICNDLFQDPNSGIEVTKYGLQGDRKVIQWKQVQEILKSA